jgi:hypothetical protein
LKICTGCPGYVNGQPVQIFKVTTPDTNVREYHGIDFIVEARPAPNWDIYAAYTLSWLFGRGSEQLGQLGTGSSYFNPRQALFYDGFLPEDHRHALKLRTSYTWKGVSMGVLFSYLSGSPLSKQFFNLNQQAFINLRSPQGTDPGPQPNSARSISEFRLPDLVSVDLRVGYDFYGMIKQHVIVMADFFNLFNLNTPVALDTTAGPTFGTFVQRQEPFRFELGLRYMY